MKNLLKFTLVLLSIILCVQCSNIKPMIDLKTFEHDRIIRLADMYMSETPVTVTSFSSERSMGGIHDFYSEGDYWWPNPEDLDGPYIRRDGNTNPENFEAHRKAMRNLSKWVPALVAAYEITGDKKYAEHALDHLMAWFVNEETMMNPNLLYSQAIKGIVSGRGIGIIDTIHLIEVAKAIEKLMSLAFLDADNSELILKWFRQYNTWLTTHQYGIDERDHGNNHSAWWVAQVAEFSNLTEDTINMAFCRKLYKEVILPNQMDSLGRFSDELARTKPYSYSLFNLEAFTLICHILSTDEDNLWAYTAENGQSTRLALEFMYPFIKDKALWPYPKDIVHFDELPVRGSALFFGGLAYNSKEYIELWKNLESDPTDDEIIRTFVIRQPILWVN